MPLTQEYEILYQASAYNTAVAAGAKEAILDTPSNMRQYGQFNMLYVKNRDAIDVKIVLDDNANLTGNIFELAAGDTLILEPEDGFRFSFISQTNLHASTAETANKILFRWARMEPRGQGRQALNIAGAKVLAGQ